KGTWSNTKAADEGPANADKYFEAFASSDPGEIEQAKALTVSGSPAEAYVTHRAAVASALADGGMAAIAGDVTVTSKSDGFQICQRTATESECNLYRDIQQKGGKLSSFTVDDKKIGPRITIFDGESIRAGNLAKITAISAYETTYGQLHVTFKAESKDRPISVSRASYRAKDGRQTEAGRLAGPLMELAEDSSATFVAAFSNSMLGGKATLTINSKDFMTEAAATINVS